jgi:hypothetical protein
MAADKRGAMQECSVSLGFKPIFLGNIHDFASLNDINRSDGPETDF